MAKPSLTVYLHEDAVHLCLNEEVQTKATTVPANTILYAALYGATKKDATNHDFEYNPAPKHKVLVGDSIVTLQAALGQSVHQVYGKFDVSDGFPPHCVATTRENIKRKVHVISESGICCEL